MFPAARLQALLEAAVDHRKLFGATFSLHHRGADWQGGAGNLQADTPFFIASTTKLFVTACIMQARAAGQLALTDRISRYLQPEEMAGLHRYRGTDYGPQLTIQHLLAHTSGLPDYFEGKQAHAPSVYAAITQGEDMAWTLADVLRWSKAMRPHFAPGQPGKAHYSDTNFQLLGAILERLHGQDLASLLSEQIMRPLALVHTYLYPSIADARPLPLYYRGEARWLPQAMASFQADGGGVSTAGELLRFLRAFFEGTLFPASYLAEMARWNRIFFPLQAGVGILRFRLPWLFDPRRRIPDLIGHSGLSGTFAFCAPGEDLYLAGTVNQIAYRQTSFQLAIKLIQALRRQP